MRIAALVMAGCIISHLASAHEHIKVPSDIPMRDAPYTLAADVYLPAETGTWPAILIQTPYSKETFSPVFRFEIGDDPLLQSPDYAFVVLDWRGFFASAGAAYIGSPGRGEDGYDAVEWIADQSWCDGNVGTWGLSALGNVQMKTAAEQPPHLRGCVPLVYHFKERYSLAYPGGVYARDRNDFVYDRFGGLDTVKAHPLYDGYWVLAETYGKGHSDIDVPMLHITGWYDHETAVTIQDMLEVQSQGQAGAAGKQKLLIGPWSHSAVGAAAQGELSYPAAEHASSQAALNFFDYYLRGIDNGYDSEPVVRYFRMNSDTWETHATWPPPAADSLLYLRGDARLAPEEPSEGENGFSVVSDPDDPVPTLFGPVLESSWADQGPGDLRPVEARDDVLIFTTPPLHAPLHIEGAPVATFFVEADTDDIDLAPRLTQVYPDGRSMLLVEGIQRASLRNGFEGRALLQPETVYEVEVQFAPVAVTIPAGHQLRLVFAASNYDLFDKNMQDGSDLSDDEGAVATPATVQFNTCAAYNSHLTIPVAEPYLWAAGAAEADAIAGGSVQFSVLATSMETPTYQWYRLLDGGTRQLIVGADGPVLELTGLDTSDAGQYVAVVSTSEGDAESPVFTLHVDGGSAVPLGPAATLTMALLAVAAAALKCFERERQGS